MLLRTSATFVLSLQVCKHAIQWTFNVWVNFLHVLNSAFYQVSRFFKNLPSLFFRGEKVFFNMYISPQVLFLFVLYFPSESQVFLEVPVFPHLIVCGHFSVSQQELFLSCQSYGDQMEALVNIFYMANYWVLGKESHWVKFTFATDKFCHLKSRGLLILCSDSKIMKQNNGSFSAFWTRENHEDPVKNKKQNPNCNTQRGFCITGRGAGGHTCTGLQGSGNPKPSPQMHTSPAWMLP